MSDISRVNRIVFISYVVCAFVYVLLGYNTFYNSGVDGPKWQPVMYFILLFLPIALAGVDYSESKTGEEFRYSLYLPAVFFYGYLLLLDADHLPLLYVICMIGVSVVYCDVRFSMLLGTVVAAVHLITVVIHASNGDGKTMIRLFHMGLVLVIIFFFNFSSAVIVAIRNAKMADINAEKQRFQALASVDGKWVFDYDIKKDRLMITKNIVGNAEEKMRFDKISKEAKLQRQTGRHLISLLRSVKAANRY